MEKLQLLNTPEEKERLLKAPFDIDADPHMDPDYESDEEVPVDDGQGHLVLPFIFLFIKPLMLIFLKLESC